MRVLTLSEIMALEFGEIVPAFRAQIKQVYPQKSDTNEYGPWSIQRVLLMDGAALMTAKLFNIPEYTSQWQGVWIYVESGQNDKGKLTGIEVVKDEYRGKVSKQIKVSERATITQAQPESTPATPEPARQAPAPQQAPTPAAISPTPTAPPTQAPRASAPEPTAQARQPAPVKPQATTEDVRRAIAEAKQRLGQAANSIILAYDAAIYIGEEVMKRHPDVPAMFTPDVLEKLAISMSITLDRGGLLHGLPVGPLEAWTKKTKEGE